MAMRGSMAIDAQADFFFGGFLFSRFGAFLFPMPTVSHIRVRLTSPVDLKRHCRRGHVWFDAVPQRTLEWMSLPVLAVPFWGRPQSLPKAPTRKAASIENHQVPRLALVCKGMDLSSSHRAETGWLGLQER